MPAIIYFPDEIPDSLEKQLTDQNIDLDDINYLLLADPSILEVVENEDSDSEDESTSGTRYQPIDYQYERILSYSSDNIWRIISVDEKQTAIGVSYR